MSQLPGLQKNHLCFADGSPWAPGTWKTQDGRILHIKDMSAEHAFNILCMFEKQAKEVVYALIKERLEYAANAPDGAAMAARYEAHCLENATLHDCCNLLFSEYNDLCEVITPIIIQWRFKTTKMNEILENLFLLK